MPVAAPTDSVGVGLLVLEPRVAALFAVIATVTIFFAWALFAPLKLLDLGATAGCVRGTTSAGIVLRPSPAALEAIGTALAVILVTTLARSECEGDFGSTALRELI